MDKEKVLQIAREIDSSFKDEDVTDELFEFAGAIEAATREECAVLAFSFAEDATAAAKAKDAHNYADGYMDSAVDISDAIRNMGEDK